MSDEMIITGRPPMTGYKTGIEGTVPLPTGAATEATLLKIPGLAIPIYDYAALAQASLTDTWTFKTGGSGGTLVATVTITYTDSTKATITTVIKT